MALSRTLKLFGTLILLCGGIRAYNEVRFWMTYEEWEAPKAGPGDLSLAAPIGAPPAQPAAKAGAVTVTVTCKSSGGTKTFTCDTADDCPTDGAEVYCRDAWSRFYGGSSTPHAENWHANGVWERKRGTLALLESTRFEAPTTITVDGAERAARIHDPYEGASVALIAAAADRELPGDDELAGLVRFVQYTSDDDEERLDLELLAPFQPSEVEAQRAAWDVHLSVMGASASDGVDLARLNHARWLQTEALSPDDRKALLLILGTTASEVARKEEERVAAVEEQKKAAEREKIEALRKDPWRRLTYVATSWEWEHTKKLIDASWALPSANTCARSSDSAQDLRYRAERAAEEGKDGSKLVAEVRSKAKLIPLTIEATASGTLSRVPVTIGTDKHFALSGKPRRTSTPECWLRCCDWEGECADEYDRCYGDEFRVCGRSQPFWASVDITTTLTLPQSVEVSKGRSIEGLSGEAIVVVNKVHRACDSSSSGLWGGQVLGYRIKYGWTEVRKVINRDVSVEEALAGPESFDPARRGGRRK